MIIAKIILAKPKTGIPLDWVIQDINETASYRVQAEGALLMLTSVNTVLHVRQCLCGTEEMLKNYGEGFYDFKGEKVKAE